MTFDLEESDRGMVLLSLALCALLRPGFDYATGEIAEKLQGRAMFKDFQRFNADVVHPQQMSYESETRRLLVAASHALKSYQFGNAAPGLAEEIAQAIDAHLKTSKPEGARPQ